ncbi:MAG: VOC family protein [Parachlamydiaceae bacterium]|nr:VOC family protein [Parachlamydiaceae bacterium]
MSAIFSGIPRLDHIAIGVSSLAEAETIYKEQLGFALFPRGRHEQYGTENSGAWFADNSYLELLTYFDKEKASWLVDFLRTQEGAPFFVLQASSLDEVAGALRRQGCAAADPSVGTISYDELTDGASASWKTLFLPQNFVCGRTMFLIEYDHPTDTVHPWNRYSVHANSADRLLSVWMAVNDREVFIKEYELLGLKKGREWEDTSRGAYITEIPLGDGTKIELLQPLSSNKANDGILSQFLQKRGEGVIGFTIQVTDIKKSKCALSDNLSGYVTEMNVGQHHSIWIHPEATNGVWIELQSPVLNYTKSAS